MGAFGRRRLLAKAITPIGDFVIPSGKRTFVRGGVVVGSCSVRPLDRERRPGEGSLVRIAGG
jgi:hypothetical protein